MSYEGFVAVICENGHVAHFDAYDEEDAACSYCGAAWAQRNNVDQTNGCEGDPCICGGRELVEIAPAIVETCNMGHGHEIEAARFTFGDVKSHQYSCDNCMCEPVTGTDEDLQAAIDEGLNSGVSGRTVEEIWAGAEVRLRNRNGSHD